MALKNIGSWNVGDRCRVNFIMDGWMTGTIRAFASNPAERGRMEAIVEFSAMPHKTMHPLHDLHTVPKLGLVRRTN